MPTKVNIVLDDDVKAGLDRLVAAGGRSRVINRAIRREIVQLSREQADRRLETLREQTAPVSTADVVAQLRRDRDR